jgi:lysophospholipase L1-like esterase
MYVQGKQIRAKVPKLPEANNPQGVAIGSSENAIKVLFIGESTIAGVGVATHEEGFAGTFARLLSQNTNQTVEWKVYAKSGYTARQLNDKIIPEIDEDTADLILIGIGGNDAFTLNRPWAWLKEVQRMIKLLTEKYPNTPVLFCNMPPIKEFPAFTPLIKFVIGNLVEILGEELEKKFRKHENVYYANEVIQLPKWRERYGLSYAPNTFFSDGVHPSKLTYQVWAEDMVRIAVSQILKSEPTV